MTLLFLASGGVIPLGLLFWLLMIFWLVFGVFWVNWPISNWRPVGGGLLLWILLALLGLAEFGFPIGGR